MSIGNILLTTDFSDEARAAYPCAAGIARRFGAKIHLVHVAESLPPILSDLPGDAEWKELEESVRGEAEEQASVFEGVRVEPHLLRHPMPHRALRDFQRLHWIDLVVVATAGHTGLEYFLLGSFAERTIHTSSVPVLVYRKQKEKGADAAPRSVLVPYDFSEHSRAVLPAVRFLSSNYGARFTFLFVQEPTASRLPFYRSLSKRLKDAPKKATELFARLRSEELSGVEAGLEVREGVPYAEIVEQARALSVDLILLATRVTLGSVAQKVTREAPSSVLTMPAPDRQEA